MQLSKKAEQILSDNGYKLAYQEGFLRFNYSSFDRVFIVVFGALLGLMCSFILLSSPVLFVLCLLVIVVVTVITYKRATGKSVFTIFFECGDFQINQREGNFSLVSSIDYNTSEVVNTYGLAGQGEEKQYKLTISLQTKKQDMIDVFIFTCDQAEPSQEVFEVIRFLEGILKNCKNV